jgi:hypothetical protein
MTTTYTIFLVNQQSKTNTFYLFLDAPEVTGDPKIYANSNAFITIAGGSPGINTFGIPVQYVVGATSTNRPVKLKTEIKASIKQDTDLKKAG